MAFDCNNAITLLLVYDVPTSVAFYRDILGFNVTNTSEPFDNAKDNYGWALLQKNNVQLMLNNMYENNARPAQPDALRTRHHSDTTIYMSCPNADEAHAYLQSIGVAASGPVDTYYGMRQVTLLDPDGYSLVFQHPL